jgi:MscS family membrane protein
MSALLLLMARFQEWLSRLPAVLPLAQESATGEVSGVTPGEPISAVERVVEQVTETLPALTDISPVEWISSFVAILVAVILRRVLLTFLETRAKAWTAKTKTNLDELAIEASSKPLGYFIIFLGIYIALRLLGLPQHFFESIGGVIRAILIVIVGWLFVRLSDVAAEYLAGLTQRTESKLDDQLIPLIRKSLKIFIAVITFVTVVQELGFNVSSIIAGLGIGGLAVALAARDTLANLFGSFVILFDRPFQVGDWIVADEVEGIVEEVGFRSTRIRTFAKTLITMPNSKLADASINNWSRMPIRRVKMTVGVTYETSADQMEQAVEKIKEILRNHRLVYQDFFLVYFTDFGACSLDIFLYYFTTTIVWAEYLQVRQEVNISIMRTLEELGLEIAFPSHSIYIRDGRGGTFDPSMLGPREEASGQLPDEPPDRKPE